jgi:hypothetical protein
MYKFYYKVNCLTARSSQSCQLKACSQLDEERVSTQSTIHLGLIANHQGADKAYALRLIASQLRACDALNLWCVEQGR